MMHHNNRHWYFLDPVQVYHHTMLSIQVFPPHDAVSQEGRQNFWKPIPKSDGSRENSVPRTVYIVISNTFHGL